MTEALRTAQRLGAFGPGDVDGIITHAAGFVAALDGVHGTVVDLGSGGGAPGLVIAVARPDLKVLLVDRRRGRADLLERLIGRLGLGDRVAARCADAVTLAGPTWRPVDAAVARSFGPPAATLAAARPLVVDGGVLVISEPPTGWRWKDSELAAARVAHRPFDGPPGAGRVVVFECST